MQSATTPPRRDNVEWNRAIAKRVQAVHPSANYGRVVGVDCSFTYRRI